MKFKYRCAEKIVDVSDSQPTILDISRDNRIPHLHECGGNGRCTTCRVRVLEGAQNLTPPTEAEASLAKSRGWDETTRLACQARVTGDVSVTRLLKTIAEVSQLQIERLPEGKGTTRNLAILFCDMRNFTPFVESNLAFDVVHILNRFFSYLGDSILINGGLIYQYIGDEITGLFGLGDESAGEVCLHAVRAALDMMDSLDRLNEELRNDFGTELSVGIGIHYGEVIVGKIGHPSDRRFAVVGDSINVASRIQGANKEIGTRFLVSSEVKAQLPKDTLQLGKTDTLTLKGKKERFELSEVLGFTAPDAPQIIHATWKVLGAENAHFAKRFYERLFQACPHLSKLFTGDIETQAQMLTQMLETVIYATNRPENLILGLSDLGRRHEGYGVKSDHYEIVRDCLLDTIREVLGEERYTPEVEDAWKSTINSLTRVMIG